MFKSILSGMFHQFMAGRLRAEMPGADEQVIENIVQKNAGMPSAPERRRRPVRNPFQLGDLAYDWRFEVPRIGAL